METRTGVEQFRLDNGLTTILVPHRLAPVVAMQAWVGVGSVDEEPAQAGIAHVFEHMLFKGTEDRGIGEIAREVESAGGEINAWTSFHHTVFHVVLASQYFDIGLDVLADALQRSTFNPAELEREREVVVEEILQSRDNPMRNVAQALLSSTFAGHPYGRPVIGTEATVRSLGRAHMLGFFRRWYVANNTTLVVAGDFDARRVKRAVARAFGAMQRRRLTRPRLGDLAQRGPRATVLARDVRESYVAMGFPIPPVRDPDLAALDVAAIVLGQGESSRLVSELRRARELVTGVHAHAQPLREHGLFVVSATASHDRLGDVVEAAAAEAFRLAAGDIQASELDKAQRAIEADIVYQRETAQAVARAHGYYHANTGDAEFEASYLDRIRRLTPAEIQRVLATYLSPASISVAAVVPRTSAPAPASVARQLSSHVRRAARNGKRPRARAATPRTSAPVIIREVLPSGMRVVIQPDPSVPVVAMRAVWPGGVRLETVENNGVTTLLSRMILRGCRGMSAETIIARVDELAGSLGGVAGRNSFGLRAEWLARSWEQGLELMASCIASPDFDADELGREKRRLGDELRAREDSPSFVVFRAFVEALYRSHPYRLDVAGTPESVAGIGRRQLASFYQRNFPVSGLTLAIVGDVDPDRVLVHVRRLFGAQVPVAQPQRTIARERFTGRPASSREVYRYVDREQAHLIIGFPGTTLDSPDRHVIEVLTTILGGQGGRLFVELRDKQALAYRLSATSVEGMDPGYIAVYLACSPDKLPAAVEDIRIELDRLVAEPVSADELERAKRYLIGTHDISLQRRSAVAAALAFHEAYGLGYEQHLAYADAIRAITVEDVQRAAASYLDWSVAVTATVKPTDASPEAERRVRGVRKRAPRGARARAREGRSE